MEIRAAIIGFNSNKTCFVSIPSSWLNGFSKVDSYGHDAKQTVYEVSDGASTAYVSWAGDILQSSSDDIEMNGLFANKLGFKHGSEVTVKPVQNVVPASRVFVEPVSFDDWEILELHAGYIENNLLNQVRLVWDGQVLPVWVTKSICIFVSVAKLEPSCKCAILQQMTEVVVSPKSRQRDSLPKFTSPTNMSATKVKKGDNPPNDVLASNLATAKTRPSSSNIARTGVTPGDHSTHYMDTSSNAGKEKIRKGICTESQVSMFWNMLTYIKSFVFPAEENAGSDKSADSVTERVIPEISKTEVNLKLRVQSLKYSDIKNTKSFLAKKLPDLESIQNSIFPDTGEINLVEQPTTVYVLASSFVNAHGGLFKAADIPSTFLAVVTKLLSPSEREEKAEKSKKLESMKDKDIGSPDSDKIDKGSSNEVIVDPCCIVRVVVIGSASDAVDDLPVKDYPLKGYVLMPNILRRQVGFETSSYVHVERVLVGANVPNEATLLALVDLPNKFLPEMVLFAFKSWLSRVASSAHPLVCCQGTLLKFPLLPDFVGEFFITFNDDPKSKMESSSKLFYYMIHSDMLKSVTLKFAGRLTSSNKPKPIKTLPFWNIRELDPPCPNTRIEHLGGVSELSRKAITHLTTALAVRPLANDLFGGSMGVCSGGLLISGPRGSGKTSLARALCNEMAKFPNMAFLKIVDCKPFRAKRVDSIKTMWQKVFNECGWRQPSLILLDDLDHVAPAPSGHEQEMSGEAVYFARVAKALIDILDSEIVQQSQIVVMATSQSRASLHHSLVSSRGSHYFQEFIEIKPPNLCQRKSILDAVIVSKENISLEALTTADLQLWASKTQGCVARDLVKLVDRSVHAHLMTSSDTKVGEAKLNDADFEVAMHGFQPTSLQNVSLHKAGDLGWKDIGNLNEVKKILMETLQWPSKYPTLFANSPLRLRSGILLYGAPGTGKTLLASVVANECGLNFISIKGPELLSKYIGASEQAVRDTFYRAQSAKPCILFFDEFDAIAPRRGHDSTGVTDRVVNQLLTQLDGVEGLDGVYVLAATSRPDLIDPALLRPGRLDKSVCCPLPDEDGRYEILQALTRNIHLSDDVDLCVVAKSCDHFTGADFKALLYNAQLEAIHQSTGYRYTEIDSCTVQATDEVDKTVVVFDKDSSQTTPEILFMPTLEDGVVDISMEFKEKLLAEIGCLTAKKKLETTDAKKSTPITMAISQAHLIKAAKNMRPSVSEKERNKYQAIYDNFVASRGANFMRSDIAKEKRQTLA